MTQGSVHKRLAVLYGIVGGAALGAVTGSWTLAARGPSNAATYDSPAQPPPAPRCPEGYVRWEGDSPVANASGTRTIARCDPRSSEAPFSEALELFWTPRMYLDGRLRGRALQDAVRAIAREGSLVLEPLGSPTQATVGQVPSAALSVNGSYQMPPLTMRVYLAPVGGNTLQATVVSPRARATQAATEARDVLARAEGLRAYDPQAPRERGWHVRLECPRGYTDATPANGGTAPSAYVGRYCLLPDAPAGTELTFAELTARPEGADQVRRMFQLAATSVSLVGVRTGDGFGPTETVRLGALEAYTAELAIDPPPARIRVHSYLVPANNGTVFGLAVAIPEHESAMRDRLAAWLADSRIIAPYDPGVIAERRRMHTTQAVIIPAVFTAVLGAAIGAYFRRRPAEA